MELKKCFFKYTYDKFLLTNPKFKKLERNLNDGEISSREFNEDLKKIEEESLLEIKEALVQNSNINWFYYAQDGLIWSTSDICPESALVIDKEETKKFLRDIKIECILNG